MLISQVQKFHSAQAASMLIACLFFSYLATSALSLVLCKHDLCAYHTVWYMLSLEILLVNYLSTVMCNEMHVT
jgi:hypothetical protein